MNLRNNIIKIFSVNFLSMISSIVIGFIVPAVLSIEAYSNVKTYAFYISYVGCLHLGFVDGMYMKYGGKDINASSNIYYIYYYWFIKKRCNYSIDGIKYSTYEYIIFS